MDARKRWRKEKVELRHESSRNEVGQLSIESLRKAKKWKRPGGE
jgi:hypothetical protein